MLDLHRLRLLRELEARHTVRAAAEALGYTTSAVSQQLAVLEREAGTALLERVGRNVQLTEAGRVLVRHAQTAARRRRGGRGRGRPGRRRPGRGGGPRLGVPVGVPAHRRAGGAGAGGHPPARPGRGRASWRSSRRVPALRLQQLDVVVGDEYDDQPRPVHSDLARTDLVRERVRLVLPAGPPDGRRRKVPLGGAGGAAVGRLPARHRPPRDADPDLPAARRVRARPALRLRRLPHPARAGPHDRRLRPAPRAGAGVRRARGRRA